MVFVGDSFVTACAGSSVSSELAPVSQEEQYQDLLSRLGNMLAPGSGWVDPLTAAGGTTVDPGTADWGDLAHQQPPAGGPAAGDLAEAVPSLGGGAGAPAERERSGEHKGSVASLAAGYDLDLSPDHNQDTHSQPVRHFVKNVTCSQPVLCE